jgi:hypothetical protein
MTLCFSNKSRLRHLRILIDSQNNDVFKNLKEKNNDHKENTLSFNE